MTYVLDPLSRSSMIATLATIFDVRPSEIRAYFDEAESDDQLRSHVETELATSARKYISDPVFRPGRRLAWYAVVRILKPKIIVETGVDKGLGSVLLCAALLRNSEAGYSGRYFGTDKNPSAGELLSGPYSSIGQILYGDSIESLNRFDQKIDLFVNDSDHSADYEGREYDIIAPKLAPNSVIIGDNSRWSDRLMVFSERHNRRFIFIDEKSDLPWLSNEGLGLSLSPSAY